MTPRLTAHATGALASYGSEDSQDRLASGLGWSAGAGGELFLSPTRALALNVHRWSGRFDEFHDGARSTPADLDGSVVRVSLGLTLRPPRDPPR